MHRMVVVRNPTSGRGAGTREWPRLRSLLDKHGEGFEIADLVTTPGATTILAQKAVADGADVVVACGGDGTIMQVAAGVAGSGVPLGLLPLGTGNDLCRTLCVHGDLERAVRILFEGERRKIDVGKWRCGDREGMFLNVAGTGFDAAVADRINAGYRFLRGTAAYVAAVAEKLATFRAVPCRICVDDEVCETNVLLCAVANARSYGGGMLVAPGAELDDGLFDVVVVQGVGRVEFLRTFPKVFKGTHIGHPKVRVMKGTKVTVDAEKPLPVLADGETIGQTPVTFWVEPLALTIIVPS